MSTATAPLDRLIEQAPALYGRVAAAVTHGKRSIVTEAEAVTIDGLVPARLVRFFRDGNGLWVEATD